MALKAVVDSLDDVEEGFRGLYTQVGEQFEIALDNHTAHSGMKKLVNEAAQRRIAGKKSADALAAYTTAFGERKIEDILAMLDRYPELEAAAAGKLDDTKINGIVEARLKSKLAPVERERDTFRSQIEERDGIIEAFKSKERTRTIHDSVREAVGKQQGFQASALEDALMQAERIFEVDESGAVVTKDNVGVTPGIDATVWLTEMQQKRPHWWGATSGGGSRGNNGQGSGFAGNNPWSSEHWNLTEQGKILRANRKQAEQLAKSAGTVLGGRRPAPKQQQQRQ